MRRSLILALTAIAVPLGLVGCRSTVDRDEYVKANENVFHQLPVSLARGWNERCRPPTAGERAARSSDTPHSSTPSFPLVRRRRWWRPFSDSTSNPRGALLICSVR